MNKYQTFSDQAQEARRQRQACENKKAFPTEKAAYQKGQRSYQCPYCQKWHRSGSVATLAARLKKLARGNR